MPTIIEMSSGQVLSAPGQGRSKKARRRARRRASQRQVMVVSAANQPVRMSAAAAGRSARKPRARKNFGRGGAEVRNPYLATLLEPDTYRGVKIPDPITLPSNTWTYELDTTVTSDSTNGAGCFAFCPIAAANSQGSAIGNCALFGGNSGTTGGLAFVPSSANQNILALFGRLRVVSACIIAYSTASPLNTSGRVCTFQIPANQTNLTVGSVSSSTAGAFALFTQLPYSFVDHFAQGAIARYAPSDPTEFNYQSTGTSTSLTAYTVASNVLTSVGPGSVIGIAWFGAPSAGTVAIRIVANYEFLPTTDAIDFVNRDASPWNQGWLDQVNAFVQRHGDTFLKVGTKALGIGAAALETVLPGLAGLAVGVGRQAVRSLVGRYDVGPGPSASRTIPY